MTDLANTPENCGGHSDLAASSTMALMQVDLAFAESGITADLPEGFRYCILEEKTARPLADWRTLLETALDEPIGTRPLGELARGKRTAAISVCDITRP